MTEIALPLAIWEGEIKVGTNTIRCYVLDTGQRILNIEDVSNFYIHYDGKGTPEEMMALVDFTLGEGIPDGIRGNHAADGGAGHRPSGY